MVMASVTVRVTQGHAIARHVNARPHLYHTRRCLRRLAAAYLGKSCTRVPQILRYVMNGGRDATKSTLQVQTLHVTCTRRMCMKHCVVLASVTA
jgi:hypothetical protein